MTTLVVTAVEAERDAVVADLGRPRELRVGGYAGLLIDTPDGELHAFHVGVGPVAAASATAALLALGPSYDLVISAGIAGGFAGRVAVADLVLADEVIAADQGALTDDGFQSLRALELPGNGGYALAPDSLRARLERGPYRVVVGAVLTLSCMTGTRQRAEELAARHPRAVAEAMEGYGVVEAVRRDLLRRDDGPACAEVRAISNIIGPREKSTWDVPAAFKTLSSAFALLTQLPGVA